MPRAAPRRSKLELVADPRDSPDDSFVTASGMGGTRGFARPRRVSSRTRAQRIRSGVPARVPAQPEPAHDLQQAGMVRQAERLRRARDLPVILVERGEHDLTFGLRLQRRQRSGLRRGVRRLVSIVAPIVTPILAANLGRHIGRPDRRASDAIIIRSRQFRSSRTLFRRQS